VTVHGSIRFLRGPGKRAARRVIHVLHVVWHGCADQSTYDVRWNIQTLSNFVSLVTVSARLKARARTRSCFHFPVDDSHDVGGN